MRSLSKLPPAFANLDGETALAQATAKGAAIFRDGSDTFYTPGPSAGLPRHTWRGPYAGAHEAARYALAELDAPARRYVTGDNAPGFLPDVEPRGPWNGWKDAHRDLVSLIEADAESRLDDADHAAEGDERGEAQSYVRAELGRVQAELGLLSGCEQLDGADVLFMGRAFFIRPAGDARSQGYRVAPSYWSETGGGAGVSYMAFTPEDERAPDDYGSEADAWRACEAHASGAGWTDPDAPRAPLAAVQAAQAALDGHDSALHLEPGNGPRVALFHLLASLIEWADAQSPRVDFDAVLGEVREHFAGEA